jgi:hypothetical protein
MQKTTAAANKTGSCTTHPFYIKKTLGRRVQLLFPHVEGIVFAKHADELFIINFVLLWLFGAK